MKKIVKTAMVLSVLLLGGCSSSSQKQFSDVLTNSMDAKDTQNFTVQLSDLTVEEGTKNAAALTKVMDQLKNIELSGQTSKEITEDSAKVVASVDVKGLPNNQTFPTIKTAQDGDKMYISADIFSFIAQMSRTKLDTSKLTGKFVDLGTVTDEVPATKQISGLNQKVENIKQLTEAKKNVETYLKTIDKKRFVKQDNKITLSLTNDEVMSYLEQKLTDDDSKKSLDQLKETIEEITVDMTADPSNKQMVYVINLGAKAGKGIKKAQITITTTKAEYSEPTMPTSDSIISEEDLEKALTPAKATMSNEQFEKIYKQLETAKKSLTDAEKKQWLELLKPNVSSEQYKKVEALFKS